MSTTAEIQAYVRANTATAYSYEGDLHALCDLAGVPAGHLLERLGALLETLPQGVLALLQNGSVEELLPILAPFSPASLFANGEQGVWYDPSDLSTLFQDAAGTVPVTAVGQPVGKILDKSGRGNHATQSTTTSRPTLQQDTSGKYYLSFDGVDDSLVTPSINFTDTDKMTVFTADHSVWDGSIHVLAGLSASAFSNNGTFWLTAYDWNSVGTHSIAYLRGTLRGAAPYGTDQRTMGVRHLVRSIKMDIGQSSLPEEVIVRVNGEAQTLAGAPLDKSAGSGNFGNWPLYIGIINSQHPFSGRLYGLIVRGAQTDDAHLTHAEKYLAYKSGVTL